MLYQLSYEATHWERGHLFPCSEMIWSIYSLRGSFPFGSHARFILGEILFGSRARFSPWAKTPKIGFFCTNWRDQCYHIFFNLHLLKFTKLNDINAESVAILMKWPENWRGRGLQLNKKIWQSCLMLNIKKLISLDHDIRKKWYLEILCISMRLSFREVACVYFVVMAMNSVETKIFAFGYLFPRIAKSWKQGIFPCTVS